MARKWKVMVEGQEHTCEVKIHFGGEREILVDGKVVKALSPRVERTRKGGLLFGRTEKSKDYGDQVVEFEIEGKPAIIQRKGLSLAGADYNLFFVDGQRIG
jgi:hypothetical protein